MSQHCPTCGNKLPKNFPTWRRWTAEEDAIVREFSARGPEWIHRHRLQNRSMDAINARRQTLERVEGVRLPRLYRVQPLKVVSPIDFSRDGNPIRFEGASK